MNQTFVIITPARNEAAHLERVAESIISQTRRPTRWIIVDDGSTDATEIVIGTYLKQHGFIRFLRVGGPGSRSFASKARAFRAGVALLADIEYDFIGNLDADISLAPEYYENILKEFLSDPTLGIAGGAVYTQGRRGFTTDDTAEDNVGGAVQLFRRECFIAVGGYLPLEHGGIDAAAEILARMKGWKVKKFPENKVWEHRLTGSVGNTAIKSMYKLGVRFHTLGYSTGFFILKSFYRVGSGSSLLGSAAMLAGFLWARLTRCPLSLPAEAVSHLRSEQARKLRGWFLRELQLPLRERD